MRRQEYPRSAYPQNRGPPDGLTSLHSGNPPTEQDLRPGPHLGGVAGKDVVSTERSSDEQRCRSRTSQKVSKPRRDAGVEVPGLDAWPTLPRAIRALVHLALTVSGQEPSPDDNPLMDGDEPDWVSVIDLADRYRVFPLLLEGIQTLFPALGESAELSPLVSFRGLHHERCEMLVEAHAHCMAQLRSEGIQAVTYKGPVLAQIAYGNHRLRDFRDFDVIVPRESFEAALARMQREGYRIDLKMQAECHLESKVGQYPLFVDVHNRLTDIYFPEPENIERLWKGLEVAELGQQEILTFDHEGHLFICCIHLVKEWHNHEPFLGYALDVAMLLSGHSPSDWRDMLDRAQAMGLGPYAKLGFTLAACLLERDPALIWEGHQKDDPLMALCAKFLDDLARLTEPAAQPKLKFYSARSLGVRRVLASSTSAWLAIELRLLTGQLFFVDEDDMKWLPLPKGLRPLYTLLRPLRLLTRYFARRPPVRS